MSGEAVLPLDALAGKRGRRLTYLLEVRGARPGCRRRPVLTERYLIGSDAVCDLRLDGRLAAPWHCLIRRTDDRLEVERLSNVPLCVNGQAVDHSELVPGDVLGVASVRLVVQVLNVPLAVVRPGEDVPIPSAAAPELATALAERTATELVELIETEEEIVRDFHERRRAGAAALLDVLHRTGRPAPQAAAEEPSALGRAALRATIRAQNAVTRAA